MGATMPAWTHDVSEKAYPVVPIAVLARGQTPVPRGEHGRRVEPRVFATIPVEIFYGRERRRLSTHDVSFKGLFIKTTERVPECTLLRLEIPRISGPALVLHGTVIRRQADAGTASSMVPGLGIKLFGLGQAERAEWEALVAGLREATAGTAEGECADPQVRLQLRLRTPEELASLVHQILDQRAVLLACPVSYRAGTRLVLELLHPVTGQPHSLPAIAEHVAARRGAFIITPRIALDHRAAEALRRFLDPSTMASVAVMWIRD
jgi:hypothetical protein